MSTLLSQPIVGLIITIAAYSAGVWIYRRLGSPLAHPLVVGQILIIAVILATPLTLGQFQAGGDLISLFILPATTVLALHIHRQWARFQDNLLPVAAGCLVGSVVSIGSVIVLCRLFGVNDILAASLMPKSVTTAIALELSALGGGIEAITLSAVIFTGIVGAVLCPMLIKWFRLDGPVEIGVSVGACAHAIGTSKALEMGEVEGAMGGIALVLSGIFTSLIYVVFFF